MVSLAPAMQKVPAGFRLPALELQAGAGGGRLGARRGALRQRSCPGLQRSSSCTAEASPKHRSAADDGGHSQRIGAQRLAIDALGQLLSQPAGQPKAKHSASRAATPSTHVPSDEETPIAAPRRGAAPAQPVRAHRAQAGSPGAMRVQEAATPSTSAPSDDETPMQVAHWRGAPHCMVCADSRDAEAQPANWRRGKKIGQGGFGTVYRALHLDSGKLCAVREIVDQGRADRTLPLKADIESLGSLRHPNLVRYLGCAAARGTFCVFTEFIAGGSLELVLQQFGALSGVLLTDTARSVLDGLRYLHSQRPKVVHGSIRCANILVDLDMTPKLADFGLSWHAAGTLTSSHAWTSPEVLRGSRPGKRSDVWSFGCAVLEMATGKPPWTAAGPPGPTAEASLAKAVLASDDGPPVPAELTSECHEFLSRCWRPQQTRASASGLLAHPFVR